MSNLGNYINSNDDLTYNPSEEEIRLGSFNILEEDDARTRQLINDSHNTGAQGDFFDDSHISEHDDDSEEDLDDSNIATELGLDGDLELRKTNEQKLELQRCLSSYNIAVLDVEDYASRHRCSWTKAAHDLGIADPDNMSLYGIEKDASGAFRLLSKKPVVINATDQDMKEREAEHLIDSGVYSPVEAYRRVGLIHDRPDQTVALNGIEKVIKSLADSGVPYSEIHKRFGPK